MAENPTLSGLVKIEWKGSAGTAIAQPSGNLTRNVLKSRSSFTAKRLGRNRFIPDHAAQRDASPHLKTLFTPMSRECRKKTVSLPKFDRSIKRGFHDNANHLIEVRSTGPEP
ncbi:MAG: hypothetical protein ACKVJU_18925 [Verrucomicrobiales bacterium]